MIDARQPSVGGPIVELDLIELKLPCLRAQRIVVLGRRIVPASP